MSRKIVAATAAIVTAAATLLAAPAADAAGRGITHVKVSKKHTVTVSATLRPGLVHLRNDGSRPFALFRKKSEGSDRLVTYMNAEKESVARRAFSRFGFVQLAFGKADSYVKITRGTYYFVDVSGEKIRSKGVRTVTVRGKGSNVRRPAYRSLRVLANGTFDGATSGGVKPYLRIHNYSKQARFVSTLTVRADVTDAQLQAALADRSGKKLVDVLDLDHAPGLTGYVGAGQDITLRTTLGRGRYLLTNFAVLGTTSGAFGSNRPRVFTVR